MAIAPNGYIMYVSPRMVAVRRTNSSQATVGSKTTLGQGTRLWLIGASHWAQTSTFKALSWTYLHSQEVSKVPAFYALASWANKLLFCKLLVLLQRGLNLPRKKLHRQEELLPLGSMCKGQWTASRHTGYLGRPCQLSQRSRSLLWPLFALAFATWRVCLLIASREPEWELINCRIAAWVGAAIISPFVTTERTKASPMFVEPFLSCDALVHSVPPNFLIASLHRVNGVLLLLAPSLGSRLLHITEYK